VVSTATAAYPDVHSEPATTALREHLRGLAAAADEVPVWSTLVVIGRSEVIGAHGRV
jgi:hypothetical protein